MTQDRRLPADGRTRQRSLRRTLPLLVVGVLAVVAALVLVRTDDGQRPAEASGATASSGCTSTSSRAAGTEVLHLAPEPSGAGDGSSWAAAGELADLPRLLPDLADGGEVWLRADDGPYTVTSTIPIGSGGSCGAPVVVRGVGEDGTPVKAVLRGDRTVPYSADGRSGTDVFSLRGGAAHLAFRDLDFQDVGNAFLAAGDVSDVEIADTTATNVRRFFANVRSEREDSADVARLVLRRVTVTGFSKRVLHLRYDSHDILVEDVVGDSQEQDGDDFAIGVHLEDRVHDVVLRRVTMRNTRDSLREYWNGDGFATERDVHDVRFEDTVSTGNTDAGYDLKSTRTVLLRAVSSGNKRNFRFWSDDVVADQCQGLDPLKRGGDSSQAQVWLGEGARARLTGCTFTDVDLRTVVFDLEADARLRLEAGSLQYRGLLQRTLEGATVDLVDVTS